MDTNKRGYSDAFRDLHCLAVDTLSVIEDLDSNDPVALATKSIASFLSTLRVSGQQRFGWGTKEQALEVIGGLTEAEWNNIKAMMIDYTTSRPSIATSALIPVRKAWIMDLETVWAFGR